MPNIYLQHLQVNYKKFMKVVFFNVGAALSAYVETDNKKIVIDLGKSRDFSPVNDFLLPLFKKRGEEKYSGDKYYLSQVFISHPHQDHISDLSDLDKHFYIDLYTTPNDLTKGADAHRKNVNWNLVDDPDSDDVKKVKEVYKGRQLPLRVSLPTKMTLGYMYPGDVEDNETLTNVSSASLISVSRSFLDMAVM